MAMGALPVPHEGLHKFIQLNRLQLGLTATFHTGQFQLSVQLDTVVGQNTAAALILSLAVSVELALLAKGVAIVFNVSPTMSVVDFIAVSAVGGAIASMVVLAITLVLAAGSVRYGWDLDNVVAPLVTATGDVITLPALVWAASIAGMEGVTTTVALFVSGLSIIGVPPSPSAIGLARGGRKAA